MTMMIDPKFVKYFEEAILPTIPFGGAALDYDDPELDEDDD
jgi:hypothetical protein